MNTQKPEALRLADRITGNWTALLGQHCASELRRLHAAVEMLEAENFRRYQENEDLKRLASEMFAAEDAYGCGFYNEEAWNKAYNAMRAVLISP